jgi:hypothetical protein
VIDTTALTIKVDGVAVNLASAFTKPQTGAKEIWVVRFADVQLLGPVQVTGSRLLAIVSKQDIWIHGAFDASAHLSTPGPGGWSHAETHPGKGGVATCNELRSGGGGGGGMRSTGGHGGNSTTNPIMSGGTSGAALADQDGSPLQAGAAGYQCTSYSFGTGGGGGGGILLAAARKIQIGKLFLLQGSIDVSGGGGQSGPAGGGAGGTLLIEAPEVYLNNAWLYARGGGGGCSGSGADGRDGGNGCSIVVQGGHGGFATSNGASSAGTDGASLASVGGGGGGSAGLIRVKVGAAQGAPVTTGATILPTSGNGYSAGTLTPQ